MGRSIHTGLLPIGSWTANAEIRQGVHIFAGSRAGDTLLSRASGNPQAFVLRGSASLTHQFSIELIESSSVSRNEKTVVSTSLSKFEILRWYLNRCWDHG